VGIEKRNSQGGILSASQIQHILMNPFSYGGPRSGRSPFSIRSKPYCADPGASEIAGCLARVGRRRCRACSQIRGGICHSGQRRPRRGSVAASHPHCTDRFHSGLRPRRHRLCRGSSSAGRQHDRVYPVRIQHERNTWRCSRRSRPV